MALYSVVFLGSTPIGGPIVGWISSDWGPRMGLAVGAAGAIAAGIGGFLPARAAASGRRAAPIAAERPAQPA